MADGRAVRHSTDPALPLFGVRVEMACHCRLCPRCSLLIDADGLVRRRLWLRAAGFDECTTGLDTFLKVVAYVVLVFVAILMSVPIAFSVATSFKTQAEAAQLDWGNMLRVTNPIEDWYRQVLDLGIGRWFLNSAIVAAVWVVSRCVFDAMAGYAFARMSFPGRNFVFLLVVSTLMIPGIVTLIPTYVLLREMGLYNSLGALTVPFLSSALDIFLMKQFFESLPRELEEAAWIDGASRFRMFWQIALPNAAPALT